MSAVGSLMYLAIGTHPDIAYAGALSRFNANLGRVHWQQCQCVFRYLQGTRDLMLQYGGKSDIKLSTLMLTMGTWTVLALPADLLCSSGLAWLAGQVVDNPLWLNLLLRLST